MRNTTVCGTLLERFGSSLPGSTSIESRRCADSPASDSGVDAELLWKLPGGELALSVEIEQRSVTSRDDVRRMSKKSVSGTPVLIARFVSPAARDELQRTGWSYWDETGNLLIQNQDPFVWVERLGATRDPEPDRSSDVRGLRSLKGQAASIVMVKLLADRRAATLRGLSRATGVGVATVSRVVGLLRDAELLSDAKDGTIVIDDVHHVAERWALDYSFMNTFVARRYFSVLGEAIALERLPTSEVTYALTGVHAANQYLAGHGAFASLPASETWIYTRDRGVTERLLQLIADPKGNIVVSEAAFLENEDTRTLDGLEYAQPWRVAGDLLSTRGRTASVGEELAQALDDGTI